MQDNENDKTGLPESEILNNDFGSNTDDAVVIDEPDRTVLLTRDETLVIEKQPEMPITPTNRPRRVYLGMWSPIAVATVGVGMLAIIAVVILYFFQVIPSKRELESRRVERDRIEADFIAATGKYGDITSVETQVAKLITSVDDFESAYLPVSSLGQTAIYQRINGLIGGYGLINTNGPNYAPLDINDADQPNQSESERGRTRFRSLFPGVYITMTVEGPYQNIRRFIREIETGREFVIISSVELAPSESSAARAPETAQTIEPQFQMDPRMSQGPNLTSQQRAQIQQQLQIPNLTPQQRAQLLQQLQMQPQPQQQLQQSAPANRGTTHGQIVSLRLEMASYFRRPGMAVDPAANGGF
ncbi:MAG: hypothetical protein H0V76_06655 [Blastocatellia bacterium]|nr:hypothetical protein [Blastocatellia bacterium]